MTSIEDNKKFLTDSVLILERIDARISKMADSGEQNSYIFEGIFAEFDGQKNENGRIYKTEDYLPHLKYLNESIKGGNLVGEIDHPEKLEPSLKNASHIIESLEFNSSTKQVIGKIRLLTTPAGEIARRLSDDGVALSISSRAVGRVREDKTVDLQKIITFDLVAQPGFKNARLNRINESLGILDEDIAIYDLSGEEKQSLMLSNTNNENKKFENSMVNNMEITKLRESYDELLSKFGEREEAFSKLSENYNNSLDRIVALEEYMEKLSKVTLGANDEEVKSITLESLKEQIDSISETINNTINNNIEMSESKIEELSKIISNNISPTIDILGKYVDTEVSESFETLKNEIDIIKEFLLEFTNTHGPSIVKLEPYMDYLSDKVVESVKDLQEYTSNLNENITLLEEGIKNEFDTLTEHVDMSNEVVNTFINYQSEINENKNLNNSITESLNESKKVESTEDYIDNRERKMADNKELFNKILESVTIKKQNAVNESNVSAYLSFLSNENRNKFLMLDGDIKTKITNDILNLKPVNEAQILAIWERNENPVTEWDKNEDLLRFLPKNLKISFDKLDESIKTKIFEESKLWDLSNDRMKTNFWLSRKSLFENLYENENLDKTKLDSNGVELYKNDYMKMIASRLDSFGK